MKLQVGFKRSRGAYHLLDLARSCPFDLLDLFFHIGDQISFCIIRVVSGQLLIKVLGIVNSWYTVFYMVQPIPPSLIGIIEIIHCQGSSA